MSDNADPPSFYDSLVANDICELMKPLLEQAGYSCRYGDGKLEAQLNLGYDTPWVHVKHSIDFDCHTWHGVLFDVISRRTASGERFVPSKCQQCWKVVVRPQTLVGLFALESLQRLLDRPSKCGIEVRPTVCGLYGGYFYNHSLEEGLECYKLVRKHVDEWPNLGPDIPVILKRACTEFEHACGPSDKWEVSGEQRHIEALVDMYVVQNPNMQAQPPQIMERTRRKWIEFAYSAGDQTYKEFTNGKPLYPAYVTYHHLADQAEGGEPAGGDGSDPTPRAETRHAGMDRSAPVITGKGRGPTVELPEPR